MSVMEREAHKRHASRPSARAACRRLDAAEFDGGVFDLAWSHDGAWLAYAVSTSATSHTLTPPLSPILTIAR